MRQSTFVVSALLLAGLSQPAFSQTEVEKLFARSRGLNPTMRDYAAELGIQVNATIAVIPYHPYLVGSYLFKRPDKYKIDLKNAPSFMKKYPTVFGLNLPPLERYNCKIVEELKMEGHPVAHVTMLPKLAGQNDITRIELYFDKSNGTVPKFDTYYNQGHLFLSIHWMEQQGNWLYQRVNADFIFPSVKATLDAKYSGYKINQGLSDDLFRAQP